ncbi:4898_t:CDS:2 [Scutellospora calospora]|uniref:4898_t:CDS:1 n=1 Tax=Scutellospora calospora TaxID=85575 RepID=A0ACA9L7J5_9GLOM|nr:4898_t:CDS:2 [Scutellospora calospora]
MEEFGKIVITSVSEAYTSKTCSRCGLIKMNLGGNKRWLIGEALDIMMNFYIQAANILDKILARKGTIKSLTLADGVKEKKKTYALICETLKFVIPRYVRVNTLKTSVDKVIKHFQAKGFTHEEPIDDLTNVGPKTIRRDKHLPDLLILPSNTDLHEDSLYLSGDIILQDKASCIPAFICSPPSNSHVIDACAAPGNKTSHLSAIMKNTGKIWAFDLDKSRLNLLKKLTQKAGCKNIEAIHESFLDVDPLDQKYSSVGYILLDPSCSGSGIINRLDHLIDSSETQEQSDHSHKLKERLESLIHSVQKIVYSTCSIHAEENEHVIKRALDQTDHFVLANKDVMMPSWPRRGISNEINDEGAAEKFIRTSPNEDYTNGFFVACFVRKATQYKNTKTVSKKRKRNEDNMIIKVRDDDEWKVSILKDDSLYKKANKNK